jgi:hypothetical protein
MMRGESTATFELSPPRRNWEKTRPEYRRRAEMEKTEQLLWDGALTGGYVVP